MSGPASAFLGRQRNAYSTERRIISEFLHNKKRSPKTKTKKEGQVWPLFAPVLHQRAWSWFRRWVLPPNFRLFYSHPPSSLPPFSFFVPVFLVSLRPFPPGRCERTLSLPRIAIPSLSLSPFFSDVCVRGGEGGEIKEYFNFKERTTKGKMKETFSPDANLG